MHSLAKLRVQIEKIDTQILRLLNQRLELSTEVGRVKRKEGASTFAPEREEYLLRFLESKSSGRLSPASLRAIYREIFSSSRAEQRPITVGHLGGSAAHASYAFHAAWYRFGAAESYRSLASWAALLKALRSGAIDVAVCPVATFARAIAQNRSLGGFLPGLRVCGRIELPGVAEPFFLLGASATLAAPECGSDMAQLFHLSLEGKKRKKKAALSSRSSHSARPAGTPPVFRRWCRAHQMHALALQPLHTAGSNRFLLQSNGSHSLLEASPKASGSGISTADALQFSLQGSLQNSLQKVIGAGVTLDFLGAFSLPTLES